MEAHTVCWLSKGKVGVTTMTDWNIGKVDEHWQWRRMR
jgi:hypothetical protein